jgi:hypothetical protein
MVASVRVGCLADDKSALFVIGNCVCCASYVKWPASPVAVTRYYQGQI